MKLALVPVELISQRRRVRRAARMVRRDKLETSLAYDRFKHDVLASPAGLAGFAALGFCFDLARSRPGEGQSFVRRLGSLATLALWARRITAPETTGATTGATTGTPTTGTPTTGAPETTGTD